MKLLLSIILPVYNVAPYLGELLASLEPLAAGDVEVIFVDDKSLDSSLALLERLCATSELNVTILRNEKNEGLSHTRRIGLEAAQGQYCWFLDSDDFVDSANGKVLIESVRALAAQGIDVFLLDYLHLKPQDRFQAVGSALASGEKHYRVHEPRPRRTAASRVLDDRDEFLRGFFFDERMYFWCHVVRTEIVRGLAFPPRMMFEDIALMPRVMMVAQRVYRFAEPVIFYRHRHGSIMTTNSSTRGRDMVRAMSFNLAEFEAIRDTLKPRTRAQFLSFYLVTLMWGERTIYSGGQLGKPDLASDFRSMVEMFLTVAGTDLEAAARLAVRRVARKHVRRKRKVPQRDRESIRAVRALARGFDAYMFYCSSPRRRKYLSWVLDYMK